MLIDAAMTLAVSFDARGVLTALGWAATLTAIAAAVALLKPEVRRAWSHFWLRLVGWGLYIFVLSLFTYGVLHLSNTAALGLLGAVFAGAGALDWSRHRNRT